ncbi:MAG TPA: hypothetical protein VG276_10190 [Actinomycetes bacterium]|nr:hypothetical protein [Actinomycetes bacterium]
MAAGVGTQQAAGRRPPLWAAAAAVALVVAMPVATWWLVGDQTDPDFKRRLQADGDPAIRAGLDPDYMFRPFDIAPATERAVGVVAVVLVVAAVIVLTLASLTGRLHVGWWGVLGVLSLVGAGCGSGWRVMTAAVSGANIGGGIVLMLGGPIGLGLVGVALWGARWRIAPRQAPTTGGGSSSATEGRSPSE